MKDSEYDEILSRLGEGEKTLAAVGGAFPKWVKDEYDPSSEELACLIRRIEES